MVPPAIFERPIMDCVEELAREIIKLLQDNKTKEEIIGLYKHEDACLVGDAFVEAEAILTKLD